MGINWSSLLLGLLMLSTLCGAQGSGNVVLLGEKQNVAFDEIKAIYIANTVHALLQSCTTVTEVAAIPPVAYKGVRITEPNGRVIEAQIFPDSKDSYMVKVYTKDKGVTRLHGKYSDHAYQLISMLELRK